MTGACLLVTGICSPAIIIVLFTFYYLHYLYCIVCTEKTVCFFPRNQQITKFFKSLISQGNLFHNDDDDDDDDGNDDVDDDDEVCCLLCFGYEIYI